MGFAGAQPILRRCRAALSQNPVPGLEPGTPVLVSRKIEDVDGRVKPGQGDRLGVETRLHDTGGECITLTVTCFAAT
jgi:hypothetical protein